MLFHKVSTSSQHPNVCSTLWDVDLLWKSLKVWLKKQLIPQKLWPVNQIAAIAEKLLQETAP